MDRKAIVTGSGGLIGSECVRLLCAEGWRVIGIDNDMRQTFFGPGGTTRPVVKELAKALRNYKHLDLDIRDRAGDPRSFPARAAELHHSYRGPAFP